MPKLIVRERITGKLVETIESNDPMVLAKAKGSWGDLKSHKACEHNTIMLAMDEDIYYVISAIPARCHKLRPCIYYEGEIRSLLSVLKERASRQKVA